MTTKKCWCMIIMLTQISVPLGAQENKNPESIKERFFIAQRIENNKLEESKAVIFLDSDSQIRIGEVLYLIADSRRLIEARLARILTKEERPDFGKGPPRPAGILRWDPALKFTFNGEMVALRSPKPSVDSIGMIRSINTRAYNEKAKLQGRLRLNDREIEFPGTKKKCSLVNEEWWANPAGMGDLNNMAGLESRFNCFGKVIIKKCLINFLSITSLEEQGVYEIVESCGGPYNNTFELIRYDREKSEESIKVLFETMD